MAEHATRIDPNTGTYKSSQFNEYLGNFADKWVVTNHLSGAMIKIEQSTYESLLNNTIQPLEGSKNLDLLIKSRFVVPGQYDEVQGFKQMKAEWNKAVRSIGLQIVPTLACNLSCPYCYENQGGNTVMMSQEVMDGILRFVDETITAETKLLAVSFYGGEPLLAMKQIKYLSDELMKKADKKKFRYSASVVTNGYLLTPQVVDMLLSYRVKFVQVTLDGPQEFHDKKRMLKNGQGTWRTIIDNIKYALSARLDVNLRVNVDKENIASLERFCHELKEEGIFGRVSLGFGMVMLFGNVCRSVEGTVLTREEVEAQVGSPTMRALLKETAGYTRRLLPSLTGCVAVSPNSFIVGPAGELYKCTKTIGSPEEIGGNILVLDKTHANLVKWLGVGNQEDKICQSCSVFTLCSGNGCAFDEVIQGQKITACESRSFRMEYIENLKQLYLSKQQV